jgi:hypothetical protein
VDAFLLALNQNAVRQQPYAAVAGGSASTE